MAKLPWQSSIEVVKPHIVHIMTPRGSGTGFLLYKAKDFTAIATAAHVLNEAHFWEEPIRLRHADSGRSAIVRSGNRAVLLNHERDVAALAFDGDDLGLPDVALGLIDKGKHTRVGVDIGWLGFPAVARELCFFGGRVSAYLESEGRYLVDGVAINGVSGGPAFYSQADGAVALMGVLSAYIPNRATGEVLPGLAVAMDVVELHKMVAAFKTLEEARQQQTPPADVPAVPTAEPPLESRDSQPNLGLQPTPGVATARRG